MRDELRSRYLASTPAGCDAVISALGHNLTLRGMYGAPRKLCTDTVSQLCRVAEMLQPPRPLRLIAISTEGARARASHSASTGRTACTACTAGPAQASQAQASQIGSACMQLTLGELCCARPGTRLGSPLAWGAH